MKHSMKIFALSLGAILATAPFAACTGPEGPEESTEAASWGAQICFDNLADDITLGASDTQIAVPGGATHISAKNANGRDVQDYNTVATYDKETMTFTAKGAGTVYFTMEGGKKGLVQVVPAYATEPTEDWYYTGDSSFDLSEKESPNLGNTHDPSIIEVEEGGRPVYYMVSTGWNNVSEDDSGKTWGNPIHRSTDMVTWTYEGRTFDYDKLDEEFKNQEIYNFFYNSGALNGNYSERSASWWAPDIVPCPDGGYWLYTCVVDGAPDNGGVKIGNYSYARAACLLYHADRIRAGEFKPVLYPEGHPDAGKQVVLMQSSIKRGESERDVNGIDPQIIYTPDGKMYMAYGSFGSGDYIIELDPATGMRKDGLGWQTHETIRGYIDNNAANNAKEEIVDPNNIQELFNKTPEKVGWTHPYYGTNISRANMEAPVIARHDNVVISDETGVLTEAKTYYYSMHSYNGLGDDYQMWGGRSESVTGIFRSVNGGVVWNENSNSGSNQGNKYMGAFKWATKSEGVFEIDPILTGHNDLFTMLNGTNVAAYITRTPSYNSAQAGNHFAVQIHQYYLNSMGDLVINPNRYAGETQRGVSEEELMAYTEGGKFKMIVMANHRDTGSTLAQIANVSRDVVLTADHKITEANGTELGTWLMYGNGYIKFTFTDTLKGTDGADSGEKVYYGVVRTAWLGDQHKSGFTITCMGHTGTTRSMAMFMNNYSTLDI